MTKLAIHYSILAILSSVAIHCDSKSDGNACTPTIDTSESDWVTIPAGSFTFGSSVETPCRGKYSESQVEVTITRPFKMSSTEVTQAQWESACIPNPARKVGDNYPTVFINWYEALAYCNRLSEAANLEKCYDLSSCTGVLGGGCPFSCPEYCFIRDKCEADWAYCIEDSYVCSGEVHKYRKYSNCPGYRLPTTAEWEYAARADSTGHNYNGDVIEPGSDTSYNIKDPVVEPIAWYDYNSDGEIHPVGEKLPNPWGIYDILGNSFEWVDYVFNPRGLESAEGKEGPLVDPSGGISYDDGAFRELRGGSIITQSCRIRTSYQTANTPDERSFVYGFRPVRTIFEE